MLNRSEYLQLTARDLSHQARSLYILKLKADVMHGQNFIDFMDLSEFMGNDSRIQSFNPDFNMISALLDELEHHNLIRFEGYADAEYILHGSKSGFASLPDSFYRGFNPVKERNAGWQNALISLPLFISERTPTVPERPFPMFDTWHPGNTFDHMACNAGLINSRYTERELAEFVNFWAHKGGTDTQTGWERKFIRRLISLNMRTDENERKMRAVHKSEIRAGRTQTLKSVMTGVREYESDMYGKSGGYTDDLY